MSLKQVRQLLDSWLKGKDIYEGFVIVVIVRLNQCSLGRIYSVPAVLVYITVRMPEVADWQHCPADGSCSAFNRCTSSKIIIGLGWLGQ